jgi:pimeloyl-ACP methyl ester carboxylesterase
LTKLLATTEVLAISAAGDRSGVAVLHGTRSRRLVRSFRDPIHSGVDRSSRLFVFRCSRLRPGVQRSGCHLSAFSDGCFIRRLPSFLRGGIFLIAAPFVGDGGWPSEDIEPLSNLGAKLPKQTPLYLYHGSKDETAPFGHVDLYAKAIPHAVIRRLSGRDHQLNNDMSEVAADIRGRRR